MRALESVAAAIAVEKALAPAEPAEPTIEKPPDSAAASEECWARVLTPSLAIWRWYSAARAATELRVCSALSNDARMEVEAVAADTCSESVKAAAAASSADDTGFPGGRSVRPEIGVAPAAANPRAVGDAPVTCEPALPATPEIAMRGTSPL
jgi:hypothetical protein